MGADRSARLRPAVQPMELRREGGRRRLTADDSPTARALGSSWAQLPLVVRRLHGPCAVCGSFAVERGRGWTAAVVAQLFGLPAPGRDVPTSLEVRAGRCEFTWARRFGTRPLVTHQRALGGGALAERLGGIECVFELIATPEGIEYRQTGARLCAGPLRFPLPRVLAPRVEARTRAPRRGDGGGRWS
jgi:hypothetical protein